MYRFNKRELELKARHPSQPWLWRENWSQKRIVHHPLGAGLGLLVFAIGWNAITGTGAFLLIRDREAPVFKWLILIFPLIGLLLLWAAVRTIVLALRYGRSTLVLNSVPQNLGKKFSARLECARIPDGEIRAKIVCVLRKMGRKTVEEDILWSDEREISRASVHKTPNGIVIPIEFQLPDDARETETIDAHEDISWRVDVAMGGTKDAADISGSYEIPVFGGRDARLAERDLSMKEIEEELRRSQGS